MDSESHSSAPKRDRSRSGDQRDQRKLFINNLNGDANVKDLEDQLRKYFQKIGPVDSLVVKKNRNSDYSFAFVEMKEPADGAEAVKNTSQAEVGGAKIKVQFQDNAKRRKDSNTGCYTCGKKGHFARECHLKNESSHGIKRRSRSRSDEEDRKRRHHRRNHSDSSERRRSDSRGKKGTVEVYAERKHRSRDRDQKRKKKHKKASSSDS